MKNIIDDYYDAIGIGFGPSNLSIAVAYDTLRSTRTEKLPRITFLEKRKEFDWHPGLLLDGATMQISFLKDLITTVDPTSEYTFLNYMKKSEGLNDFINLRTFYPSRIEYRNYLKWAAQKLADLVEYQSDVISITPNIKDSIVESVSVNYVNKSTNKINRIKTKSIVLATGGTPKLPGNCSASFSDHVIHSSVFLDKLQINYPDVVGNYEFMVVGSGQSAAEIFNYLYTKYPNAKVTIVTSGIGFKQADDSEFVNKLFCQSFVDEYYASATGFRQDFLNKHADTNYSVVDKDLISEISKDIYADERLGPKRLKLIRFSNVTQIDEKDKVYVCLGNRINSQTTTESCDAVFLGTGYTNDSGLSLLDELQEFIVKDENNRPIVNRDYSLATKNITVKIFLQGPTEHTHGLSSTLLSIIPFRAQEILNLILNQVNYSEVISHHGNLDQVVSALEAF